MIGPRYWTTGITCKWFVSAIRGPGWAAELKFFDDGFCDDVHGPAGLTAALDVLIADAGRLGIELGKASPPCLYVEGDGEDAGVLLPPDWEALLREQADRLGWETYGLTREPTDDLDTAKAALPAGGES